MSEIDNATLNNKLLSELELSNKKKLELISLDRMLEVNIERNVSKNKIIYTLFSFILLVLLIMIIIKINN
jgi:hypothetical protein